MALFLFAVAENNTERAFGCSIFAVIFVYARFGIRRRLNKTIIGACLYPPLAFVFCFAIHRRRRFCFVKHRLNLDDNAHYEQYKFKQLVLLQGIPRQAETRLSRFGRRLKRTLLYTTVLGFRAYIFAHVSQNFRLRRASGGPAAPP